MMLPAVRILATNVERLIARMTDRPARPELAARMGIGDKTLGFMKAGSGNPTLENIAKVAQFFRVQPWELLKPEEVDGASPAPSQPMSGDVLMIAADAADEALKGLYLPKPHYWEIVAIAHDCIVEGMPFAEVLDILRPIASEAAKKGAKDGGITRENYAPPAADGRRKAAGNG